MPMPLLLLGEVLLVVDTYFKTRQLGNRYLKQLYIEELSSTSLQFRYAHLQVEVALMEETAIKAIIIT